MLDTAAEIFWGQAAAKLTQWSCRQEMAGGRLLMEPRAQDQAPSGGCPSSRAGHWGTPCASWGRDTPPVWSMQDCPKL